MQNTLFSNQWFASVYGVYAQRGTKVELRMRVVDGIYVVEEWDCILYECHMGLLDWDTFRLACCLMFLYFLPLTLPQPLAYSLLPLALQASWSKIRRLMLLLNNVFLRKLCETTMYFFVVFLRKKMSLFDLCECMICSIEITMAPSYSVIMTHKMSYFSLCVDAWVCPLVYVSVCSHWRISSPLPFPCDDCNLCLYPKPRVLELSASSKSLCTFVVIFSGPYFHSFTVNCWRAEIKAV